MSDEVRIGGAVALATLGVLLATPGAIRLALRLHLFDEPKGWKRHAPHTPYLGGTAVLAGLLLATLPFADGAGRFGPLLVGSAVLAAVGLVDDRSSIPAKLRVAAVAAVAAYLWTADLGWNVFDDDALDLFVTIGWTLALVNALNLLDLMDGAASAAAGASAAGVGAMALILDDVTHAAFAFALSGACVGFLRYNLARPARIFLGDGGSMPIGLLLATLIMTLPWSGEVGAAGILGGVLLFGVPLFDMTFRIYSRKRRGDTLMTAGPDSIANWLRERLPSPHAVAAALALAQGVLGSLAIAATVAGRQTLLILVGCAFALGAVLIAALDASGFGRHLAGAE